MLAERLRVEGFVTLMFSFRGAGKGGGNLDIAGRTRDPGAAIDYLCRVEPAYTTLLCLVGFSGGAAVSVCTAAHDPGISSVALCACPADFDTFREKETTSELVRQFRSIGVIRDAGFPPSAEEWERGDDTAMATVLEWLKARCQ